MNEWMNEWVNEWVSESESEQINKLLISSLSNKTHKSKITLVIQMEVRNVASWGRSSEKIMWYLEVTT